MRYILEIYDDIHININKRFDILVRILYFTNKTLKGVYIGNRVNA